MYGRGFGTVKYVMGSERYICACSSMDERQCSKLKIWRFDPSQACTMMGTYVIDSLSSANGRPADSESVNPCSNQGDRT